MCDLCVRRDSSTRVSHNLCTCVQGIEYPYNASSLECNNFVGYFLQQSPIISGSSAEETCNLPHPIGRYHTIWHDAFRSDTHESSDTHEWLRCLTRDSCTCVTHETGTRVCHKASECVCHKASKCVCVCVCILYIHVYIYVYIYHHMWVWIYI